MLDESDDIDTISPAAQDAEAATADVLTRVNSAGKAGRASAPAKEGTPDFLTKHKFIIAALADRDLSDRGTRMLTVIVEQFRDDWGFAKRGYAFLAEKAGMTERTARRAVNDCVKAGWLQKTVDRKGKDSEVNMYRPVWDKAAAVRSKMATGSGDGYGQIWPQGMATDGHTVRPDMAYQYHLSSTDSVDSGSTSKIAERAAHARDAGSASPSGLNRGRQSSTAPAREPVISLPDDFAFDPADVEAAITRGHTKDSVTTASESFRRKNAGKGKTATQWREAGKKWIENERLPSVGKSDPDEIVWVMDGMGMWSPVKRSTLKPWTYYRDSANVYHNKPKPKYSL